MRHMMMLGAIGLGMVASPALARDYNVRVNAKCSPWSIGINRKMVFGRQDGRGPAIVAIPNLVSGTKVTFKATGSTTTVAGGGSFGPDGQAEFVTDQAIGAGNYFPSKYMSPASYPVKLNQLVGAFVNADGVVIGKPFPIGSAGQATIPEGAMAIALGINDDVFSDNSGALDVVVSYSTGSVTVEPEQK